MMNRLNIDFRGGCLRVLSSRDGALRHVLITRDFDVSDLKKAKQQLSAAVAEAGGSRRKARAILPNSILKFGIFKVPPMDIGDAVKVVRREISKEIGTQDFVVGVRWIFRNQPALSGSDRAAKQEILAEYALISDVAVYRNLMKECGIRPSVLTTGLEGIISGFRKIRPETDGNEAVLEIGQSFIEIIVFNNGRLINYRKVQMPESDHAKLSGKELEQTQVFKIRLYSVVDALYRFMLEMGGETADEKISCLWISGIGSTEKETTEVLSQSLGVKCMLMKPFDAETGHPVMYTAIAGLSMVSSVDRLVNLMPTGSKDRSRFLVGNTVIIIALIFYAIMISGGYAVLSRTENDLKAMKEQSDRQDKASRKSEDRDRIQQDALRKILNNDRKLYPVFRDLANLIPPEMSLISIDLEKTADATFIRLGANLQPVDEGLRNSAVSKFLHALEATGRFAPASPPEITSKTATKMNKQEFVVKARFEVLQ